MYKSTVKEDTGYCVASVLKPEPTALKSSLPHGSNCGMRDGLLSNADVFFVGPPRLYY